jgi:hypothetical protein
VTIKERIAEARRLSAEFETALMKLHHEVEAEYGWNAMEVVVTDSMRKVAATASGMLREFGQEIKEVAK